ncbi:Arabinose operon regulatory protein [Streptococcus constellatus]|uniref:Arabinose operon regulatory protein n=1 Tax=Streptococcus constellatus TaxID=76860 RepID=A0A564TR55_STRCV|nr:AraC family transcriptional regulator [Streptococcus constellatus]VUX00360.1 Arabinose operon regulatory protein [Streptococcus gordonii]VUX09718.1 Arabinose operon regulatory protein [Streptococcus constellatus]
MNHFQDKIRYQAYLNRESNFHHHRYDEELQQYLWIKEGNPTEAANAGQAMFTSDLTGALSTDPLREKRYLFVASTTLATRFAIQGGMPEEEAYNTSDLFIQEMDKLHDIDSINHLQERMMRTFAESVQKQRKQTIQQLPILRCIEYIEDHLHQTITLDMLASHIDYSPNYISQLFQKEMKEKLSSYILRRKIEVAQNMIQSRNFNLLEISEILAFSSQSYFSKIFKKYTTQTPRQFQQSLPNEAIQTKN